MKILIIGFACFALMFIVGSASAGEGVWKDHPWIPPTAKQQPPRIAKDPWPPVRRVAPAPRGVRERKRRPICQVDAMGTLYCR